MNSRFRYVARLHCNSCDTSFASEEERDWHMRNVHRLPRQED